VSAEDFTIKHKLGKGAYGDVFLVVKNSDEKVYAMKQIQKKKLERERKEYQALVESQLYLRILLRWIIYLIHQT